MILCPNHHREATSDAMIEEEQRGYKTRPFNIQRGYVNGKLKINQNALVVTLGSNQFIRDSFLLTVDRVPLLTLGLDSRGILEVSLPLYDEKDNLLAEIKDNEWTSGQNLPWDLESRYQWLKLRQRRYKTALEVDARTYPLKIRGNLWYKQQNFEITEDGLMFNGVLKNIGISELCLVGISLDINTENKTFGISPDERYGNGIIVSGTNRKKRIRNGLQAWRNLVSGMYRKPVPAANSARS